MIIPSNSRWTQTNEGDKFGILNDTYQMNFHKPGKMKGNKKPFALYSSDSDADYSYTMSILYFVNKYWAITTDKIFSFDLAGGAVAKQATFTPTTTNASDALILKDSGGTDQMVVTIADNFCRWNGSASTSYTLGTLTSGVPHPMTIFESQTTYKLAIGDNNKVNLYANDWTKGGTVLTLPTEFQVTTLTYRNGYLYVGTKNIYGGEAKVFIWNGATANADYEVPMGGSWVFSITPHGSLIVAIINTGQLMSIEGNQARQLAALPVFYNSDAIWSDRTGLTLNGKVFHRGMRSVNGKIYINIDGSTEIGFVPEMKSGIWCYDPSVGLYHMASNTSDQVIYDDSLSVTDSVITTSAAHNLKTGDAVQFISVSGLSGVDTGVKYFVSVESTTTIKLAKSRKALQNNKFVTITGTASIDNLAYIPNTNWSSSDNATSGAIGVVSPLSLPIDMFSTPIIWGTRSDDEDGTAFYGLLGLTDSWNISRFKTQRIYSPNIEDTWNRFTTFFDGIHGDNEELVLKLTTGDKYGYPTNIFQGVWLNTNTINSVSTTYDEDEWNDIEVGNELVIVDGYGRGYSVNVTAIESSSNTFSVSVDEAIGTINKSLYFYATNAKKIRSVNNQKENLGYSSDSLETKSPWLQISGEMRGFQAEISHFNVNPKPNK